MRGFGGWWWTASSSSRFIPACAGFWPAARSFAPCSWVHPRVCGVLSGQKVYMPAPMGSSPRVRGFGRVFRYAVANLRFIPACAGFWLQDRAQRAGGQVHPRVCGVLPQRPSAGRMPLGSSPRVRGFEGNPLRARRGRGFIPACAGFWPQPAGDVQRHQVHPRVCGVLVWS